MAGWERWESSEVARRVVPGFIQEWGTQGESRFHLFASDVDQQRNEGARWVQDYLVWSQGCKDFP